MILFLSYFNKMSIRSSCWSITINNPTQNDDHNIAEVRQRGWKVDGQIEKGESGTVHYQLILTTPQVRFSSVKKAFPRAHIEPARNREALLKYVQKSESRLGQLQVPQEKYPSQLQVFDWFSSYWYDINSEKKTSNLEIFDLMCAQKIAQGYMIGAEVMNPQIRAFIKKFGDSLALRHKKLRDASRDRQTDRQPDLFSQSVSINAISSSSPLQEETSDPPSSDDER